jgi:Methyltransferase domain
MEQDSTPRGCTAIRAIEQGHSAVPKTVRPTAAASSGIEKDLFRLGRLSGIALEYPARLVPPPNWVGHIPFAFWLVDTLRPTTIVELGVHTGNSYCAFLQAVRALGLDTRCFGVDHWRGDEQTGMYGEEVFRELRAYHDPLYGSFSTLLRSSFAEALPYFSDGSVDLLHIDGFHTYEAGSSDFTSWLPKMSTRGVVLLHDTNVRERGFGIWRYWEELTSRYPTFEFLHSHGLGIVCVDSEPLPDALQSLLETRTEAEINRVRNYFSRLGQSVLERYAVQQLEREVLEREQRLVDADKEIRRVIGQADQDLRRADTEMRRLTSELAEGDKRLRRLELQIETQTRVLQQQAMKMARIQRESNQQLQQLQEDLRKVKADVAERDKHLAQADTEMRQLLGSRSWRVTAPLRFIASRLYRMT